MTEHIPTPRADTRHASSLHSPLKAAKSHPIVIATAVAVGALAVSAAFNRGRSNQAERDNPPAGKFVEINGVRLHYVERGTGEPLVLLHGNGSMVQDFESSGLIGMAAKKYRVIAFDRPGFGHSERPRSTIWTPEAQADLIHAALRKIASRVRSFSVIPGARRS